jgi:hypothetical protein
MQRMICEEHVDSNFQIIFDEHMDENLQGTNEFVSGPEHLI